MASQTLSHGVPVYTDCQLQNHAGNKQYVTLLTPPQSWHGSGDPPKTIQDQHAGNFQHDADSTGSIGGVAYVLEDKLKWVIAWSNAENVPNKVYTQIISSSEDVNWDKIKTDLNNSGNQSSDHNKFGYSSDATIDQNSGAPTMTVTLKPAA